MLHIVVYGPDGTFIPNQLSSEAYDIQINSMVITNGVGGYIEASFKIRRPINVPHPDLQEGNYVWIKDGGDYVFYGTMQEPRRTYIRQNIYEWEITCLGPGKQCGERLHNRVWVETSTALDYWTPAGSFLGGSFTTLFQENGWNFDNNNRLRVGAKKWDFLFNTGCIGGWYYKLPVPQYTEDTIKRIEFNWHLHATSASNWQAQVRVYDSDNNFLEKVWSTCLPNDTTGSTSGSEQLDLSGSAVRGILMGLSYQGIEDAYVGEDDSVLNINYTNVKLRTHGDGSGSVLYQDDFISELIRPTSNKSTEQLDFISEDTSLVTLSNPRNIGGETLRWLDGKYVVDAITDVLSMGDNSSSPQQIYFNVWYPHYRGTSASDGKAVAELQTYTLNNWEIEIPVTSINQIEIDYPDQIYTRVISKYRDEYGRMRWTSMATSGCITTYGRRDKEIEIDTTASSRAENVRDTSLYLEDHLRPKLTLTLDGPSMWRTGGLLPPWRMSAGIRAKITGIVEEIIFLIQECTYYDDSKTVRIRPGTATANLELKLARLIAEAR